DEHVPPAVVGPILVYMDRIRSQILDKQMGFCGIEKSRMNMRRLLPLGIGSTPRITYFLHERSDTSVRFNAIHAEVAARIIRNKQVFTLAIDADVAGMIA